MKYTKYYTVKQWKKFDRWAERIDGNNITMQEVLLRKYDVILTDHRTRKEKLSAVFSPKNLNKNIDKFQNGVTKFTKMLEKLDGSKVKLFEGVSQKEYDIILGKSKKKDYSILWGNSKTKTKSSKSKRKRKGAKSKQTERDYSFLTGNKKKAKFF